MTIKSLVINGCLRLVDCLCLWDCSRWVEGVLKRWVKGLQKIEKSFEGIFSKFLCENFFFHFFESKLFRHLVSQQAWLQC